MKAEKGKTFQYYKEKHAIPEHARSELKEYNSIKRSIVNALKELEQSNIPELANKLGMDTPDVVYYLMSLLKYGVVETVGLDDMDEYYIYKLKDNGKN